MTGRAESAASAGSSSSGTASGQVKSATRTLDIIEYVVSQRRPLVAQEIANALSIPVSSLSYLLATLVERSYLERDGRRYIAGAGLDRLRAYEPTFTLEERIAPLVRTLRIQLNETSSFFIRQDWDAKAIITETSQQALRYAVNSGETAPLHVLSAGKAILASLTEDELDAFFDQSPLQRFTEKTITDEHALRDQIHQIRETGFARTTEEYSLGISGIGHLVVIDGQPAGALAVAMPIVRASEDTDERIRTLLQRTTALLQDQAPSDPTQNQ